MKTCKECTRPVFGKGYCKIHQYLRPDFKASQIKRAKEAKAETTEKKKVITTKVLEARLWKVFSEFIRLRDADQNGFCKCFTCSNIRYWRDMDCGHGIGRQHKGTKYNEQNNHAQCGKCNGFEGGRSDVYKEEMNRRYGPHTWELMLVASKKPKKYTHFELEALTEHYKREADKLRAIKGDRKAA
jgi:hypothetical protein